MDEARVPVDTRGFCTRQLHADRTARRLRFGLGDKSAPACRVRRSGDSGGKLDGPLWTESRTARWRYRRYPSHHDMDIEQRNPHRSSGGFSHSRRTGIPKGNDTRRREDFPRKQHLPPRSNPVRPRLQRTGGSKSPHPYQDATKLGERTPPSLPITPANTPAITPASTSLPLPITRRDQWVIPPSLLVTESCLHLMSSPRFLHWLPRGHLRHHLLKVTSTHVCFSTSLVVVVVGVVGVPRAHQW